MSQGANRLINGALYDLPSGERVRAERSPGGLVWFLAAVDTTRSYVVDHDGALRVILVTDAAGVQQPVPGEDGRGRITDFLVDDLRRVVG
jgi:hypothetical protein